MEGTKKTRVTRTHVTDKNMDPVLRRLQTRLARLTGEDFVHGIFRSQILGEHEWIYCVSLRVFICSSNLSEENRPEVNKKILEQSAGASESQTMSTSNRFFYPVYSSPRILRALASVRSEFLHTKQVIEKNLIEEVLTELQGQGIIVNLALR